jgi:single-stranded-DNA-specific exonuclease
MPLIGENRIAVSLGLKQMQKTINEGLRALFLVAKADVSKAEAYHLGYVIGPRLNASGRLGSAMDAVRLLTTQSKDYARDLAIKLDELNLSRQELTREYIEVAEKLLLEEGLDEKIYFIYGEEWPEGIVGLIAGRLTEKYNRPFIVGSSNTEGLIKASARSIEKFNIVKALKSTDQYLSRYGGHSQAAGLSLLKNNYEAFIGELRLYTEKSLTLDDLEKSLNIEYILTAEDVSIDNAISLQSLEPFGIANQNPLVALLSFVPREIRSIGSDQSHIKFYSEKGLFNTEFIFFHYVDKFPELLYSAGKQLDIAGHLSIDSWNGRSKVVFKIREARFSA